MAMYRIVVQGHLDLNWSEWFGLFISYEEPNYTILTGQVADQAALHGILLKIRDLNLTLIALNRVQQAASEEE
jgi:hypothetical protein